MGKFLLGVLAVGVDGPSDIPDRRPEPPPAVIELPASPPLDERGSTERVLRGSIIAGLFAYCIISDNCGDLAD